MIAQKELDRTCFKTVSGHDVSWAVEYVNKDGKTVFEHYPGQICYAPIRRGLAHLKGADVKNFYFSLHCNNPQREKYAADFWSYCLSTKESPWRCLLPKGGKFSIESDVNNKSDINMGTIPVTKDTNMNALVNLGLHAKHGSDWPGRMDAYGLFREKGWSQAEAFYAALHLGPEYGNIVKGGATKLTFMTVNSGAFPNASVMPYKWIRDSTPKLDDNFKFGEPYFSTYTIWSATPIDGHRCNSNFYKAVRTPKPETKYSGMFAKAYNSNKLSKTNIIDRLTFSVDELTERRKEIFDATEKLDFGF